MDKHSDSFFNSPIRGWSSVVMLLCVSFIANSPSVVKAQQQNWSATGSLATGRFGHSATRLLNGKVLVVGGRVCSNTGCAEFTSVELYDPATGQWNVTGNLSVPRHAHVAVRLQSGKVLVAGGHDGAMTSTTAELYDPDSGQWSATGNLSAARSFATATVLDSGKVLVAGGTGFNVSSTALNTAELYDPATGSWSSAGTMNQARSFHSATLLADGKVLIASGLAGTFASPVLQLSAELYDPATGSWTPTGSLGTARAFHTETRLANGKVLITGGSNFTSVIYDTAELYDPAAGSWIATGRMTAARNSHTATLLANGKVLAVGGFNNEPVNATQKSAELYDPDTGGWTPTASLNVVRGNHAATMLADGRVLVTGGNGGGSPGLTSAELFNSIVAVPEITGASISGKALFVEGHNFDDGAKVFLNDERQKTANDETNPTGLLRCKKAGKWIAPGASVRLKVRNAFGTESAEFIYIRPVE